MAIVKRQIELSTRDHDALTPHPLSDPEPVPVDSDPEAGPVTKRTKRSSSGEVSIYPTQTDLLLTQCSRSPLDKT